MENNIPQQDESFKLPHEMTFNELLAATAQDQRNSLILSILKQAKEGDANALKLIAQAMEEQKYIEDIKFIISDDRFKEIILFAADRIRAEAPSGDAVAPF